MNTLNDVANSITVEDLVKCYNSTVSQILSWSIIFSGINNSKIKIYGFDGKEVN